MQPRTVPRMSDVAIESPEPGLHAALLAVLTAAGADELSAPHGGPAVTVNRIERLLGLAASFRDDSVVVLALNALGDAHLRAGDLYPARNAFYQLAASKPEAGITGLHRVIAAAEAVAPTHRGKLEHALLEAIASATLAVDCGDKAISTQAITDRTGNALLTTSLAHLERLAGAASQPILAWAVGGNFETTAVEILIGAAQRLHLHGRARTATTMAQAIVATAGDGPQGVSRRLRASRYVTAEPDRSVGA